MQLPAPVMCTVVPATVQLPLAAKLTVRPELAVAETVKSGSPQVLFPSAANVIVCACCAWVTVSTVEPVIPP